MNRKLIFAAIGFLITVALGSHFYVEWQMGRFDASLPKPPVPEQVRAAEVNDGHAGGHWHGDEWHAEPHVADEAPPVQPVTRPAETDEMEAARQREEAPKLPLVPLSELDLEHEAIQADFNALREQRGILSPAEYDKRQDDITRRQNAWRDKWEEQLEESAVFTREREAERKPVAVGDR